MVTPVAEPRVESATKTTCAHNWAVASIAVRGGWPAVCKLCGEKRSFPTEPAWDESQRIPKGRPNVVRQKVIEVLERAEHGLEIAEIAVAIESSEQAIRRTLQNLESVGRVDSRKSGNKKFWRLRSA